MNLKKIIKNRKGTALLVALLVMGVLMAISLALSSLVLREIRITKGMIDSGKAYYAAEAGIETALYKLNTKLPGWDTTDWNSANNDKVYFPLKIDNEDKAVAEYKVDNTCSAYPCFDESYDISNVEDLKAFYGVLGLNESITLPLFVVKEKNDNGISNLVEVPVGDFTVEFFGKFNPDSDFNEEMKKQFSSGKLNSWDVLRWKILGITKDTNFTESISDFTALSNIHFQNAKSANINVSTNSAIPAWFGTVSCTGKSDRYTEKILCNPYAVKTSSLPLKISGQESLIYAGICLNTEAREYYDYSGDKNISSEDIHPCYSIKQFISPASHKLNYLTLTNLMNPSVFEEGSSAEEKEALSKLYFRVELFKPDGASATGNLTVREYADITSNGYSGDSKKSINVKIKRGSFMPVFNFSLYSTYKSGKKVEGELHDTGYWYSEEE